MSKQIDFQLYTGRPENESGRLQKEISCYDLLDSLSIPYHRLDHEPMATIADCDEVDRILEIKICKNLFLCNSQKTKFYLFMLPGEKKFDTKQVSKQLNSPRLSFANEMYLEKILNLTPGSVTIMGLMHDTSNQVQLVIDADLLKESYLACHPNINTSSIRIKTEDVLEKLLPHFQHKPVIVELH